MSPFGVTEVVVDLGQYFTGGTNGEYIDENNNAVTLVKEDCLMANGNLTDYTRYTHILQSSMVYSYGISSITHRGVTQTGFSRNLSSCHSVTAYYWKYDVENIFPQVIDIGGSLYTMPEKRGHWAYYGPSSLQFNHELKLLHSEFNMKVVLRIDMMQNYGSIAISVDTPKNINGYLQVTHKLITRGKFTVSKFKNGSKELNGIITPPNSCIENVREVLVYFCNNRLTEPLLLYYKTVTTDKTGDKTTYRWFRKDSGTTWTFEGLDLAGDPSKLTEDKLNQLAKGQLPPTNRATSSPSSISPTLKILSGCYAGSSVIILSVVLYTFYRISSSYTIPNDSIIKIMLGFVGVILTVVAIALLGYATYTFFAHSAPIHSYLIVKIAFGVSSGSSITLLCLELYAFSTTPALILVNFLLIPMTALYTSRLERSME